MRIRTNERDLEIELRNGSIIQIKGADNPDSLLGVGLNHVVLDEFADIKPVAWFEILRPTLSDMVGTALFIGTPDGYSNWSYELYQRGLSDAENDEFWHSWLFTSLQGGNIPDEEIQDAKRDLDPRTYRQEYEASFENVGGRVYYCFDRILNNSDEIIRRGDRLLLGMDFNINRMCAAVAVMRGRYPVIVEEVVNLADTPTMISELKSRYAGHQITIYPDASAKHGDTRYGESDLDMLRQAGFTVIAGESNPPISDRVNCVNSGFLNVAGDRRLKVNVRNCPWLVSRLEAQQYKNGKPLKDGTEDILDGFGYKIVNLMPINHAVSLPGTSGKIKQVRA